MFKSVGGRAVRPHMYDGNYVVASNHKRPWRKQLNMLAGYLYFYNPVWLVVALIRTKTPVAKKPAYMQIFGMLGLAMTIVPNLRLVRAPDVRPDRAPFPSAGQSNPHAWRRRWAGKPRHFGDVERSSATAGSASRASARSGDALTGKLRAEPAG